MFAIEKFPMSSKMGVATLLGMANLHNFQFLSRLNLFSGRLSGHFVVRVCVCVCAFVNGGKRGNTPGFTPANRGNTDKRGIPRLERW